MNNIGCSSSSSCSDEFSLEETHIIELFLDKMIHDKDHPKPLTILFWIVFIVWIVSIILLNFKYVAKSLFPKTPSIVGWGILNVYLLVALALFLNFQESKRRGWAAPDTADEVAIELIFWPVWAIAGEFRF